VIDRWVGGGNVTGSHTQTLTAGTHTIIMEMYEGSGGAKAFLTTIAGDFDNPSYGGTYMPNNGDWRLKTHDLSAYAGFPSVGLRFRLDRQNVSENCCGYRNASTQSPYNWYESWWVVDITIVDP